MGDLDRVPRGPRDFRKFRRSLGSEVRNLHPNPKSARSATFEIGRLLTGLGHRRLSWA